MVGRAFFDLEERRAELGIRLKKHGANFTVQDLKDCLALIEEERGIIKERRANKILNRVKLKRSKK